MVLPFYWLFILDVCNYPNRDEDGVAQVFRSDEDSAGKIRGRLKKPPPERGWASSPHLPSPLPVSPEGGMEISRILNKGLLDGKRGWDSLRRSGFSRD
jgi:hypothetical protein